MDNEITYLYFTASIISLLLAISEALGLSGTRANSITELIIAMIKARIKKDEDEIKVVAPTNVAVPVTVVSKSVDTETSSWST